jgi:hypothetical protein
VVTTDPERLPRLGTWYLTTNLPASSAGREAEGQALLAPAGVAEVVRLYGLRMWVEQSYKQVKHALGWSDYQVRSDTAIRRHWQLVCCAFSFCWWACGEHLELGGPPEIVLEEDTQVLPTLSTTEGRGKKERAAAAAASSSSSSSSSSWTTSDVAASAEEGKGLAGALHNAFAILEGVLRDAPAIGAKSAA